MRSYELIGCSYTYLGCHVFGDGGGGGTGGGNGGGPFGGGGGTNPPVPPPHEPEVGLILRDRNIKKLNKITNDSDSPYKATIDALKLNYDSPIEIGYEFRTNSNNTIQIPPVSIPSTTDTGVMFGIPEKNALVRVHLHPNGIDPIPSAQDIAGMTEFYTVKNDKEAQDDDEIISLIITPDGAYALTVDNIQQAWNHNQYFKKDDKVKKFDKYKADYKLEVVDKAMDDCNSTCSHPEYKALLLKYFLIWFNNQNAGLGLYKGTLNADGSYTWGKIN